MQVSNSFMTVERFWGRWMLASAGGFGVGGVLGFFLARAVVGVDHIDSQGGPVLGPGGDLTYSVVAAAFAGIMQWLVLRRQVSWAGLWALASPSVMAYL